VRRLVLAFVCGACTGTIEAAPGRPDAPATAPDAAPIPDAAPPPYDAGPDARIQPECQWGGAPGMCLSAADCAAFPDHTLETGTCPAQTGCCIQTPNPADNPPIPAGWKPFTSQSMVTQAMSDWAVFIFHDPVNYPMWSTATMWFGSLDVLARVEWHVPDFQNSIVHRGVTLYQPQ
jgi:hypothetical protein